MAAASYYAAIESGVDAVDTSIAPFANGTGQPDTLLMQSMLETSPRKPDYDTQALAEIGDHFKQVYLELDAFTHLIPRIGRCSSGDIKVLNVIDIVGNRRKHICSYLQIAYDDTELP